MWSSSRGRLGQRWRSERWESLRLLTPNWQSRLPGFRYHGAGSDGYMDMTEVVGFLEEYARSFGAPLEEGRTVLGGRGGRERLSRDHGRRDLGGAERGGRHRPLRHAARAWTGRAVAQGDRPGGAGGYRNPGQLPEGGVLVVGASARGCSRRGDPHLGSAGDSRGRPRHTRLPRAYRGRDILWWPST